MRFPKAFVTSGRLADTRNLSAGDLRVLLVLIALADDKAIATATQRTIADLAGLARASVQDSLARLGSANLVEAKSARGSIASYCVLSDSPLAWPEVDRSGAVIQMTGSPVNYTPSPTPEVDRSGAVNYPSKLTGLGQSTPKGNLTRVLNSPSGGTHPYEPNAVKALTELRKARRLPLQVSELLQHAYDAGVDRDPWDGYLRIKQATDATITDARDPSAVLRARLKKLTETEEVA